MDQPIKPHLYCRKGKWYAKLKHDPRTTALGPGRSSMPSAYIALFEAQGHLAYLKRCNPQKQLARLETRHENQDE